MPKPFKPPANDRVGPELARIGKAMTRGQQSACLPRLVEMLKLHPRDPRVAFMVGSCNAQLGRHAESIAGFELASRLDPGSLDVKRALAYSLQRGGRYEQALVALEQALYIKPGDIESRRMQASVMMDLARWEDAARAVEKLLEDDRLSAQPTALRAMVEITAARLAPKHREAPAVIDRLSKIITDPGVPKPTLVTAHWHMGRLYDSIDDIDRAFQHYTESKSVGLLPWDPDEHSARIDRAIECWQGIESIPLAPRDGSRLVFILGMMRSGTSLTEQMIAQIPGVTPGGELNAVSRQVAVIDPVPNGLARPMAYTRSRYGKANIDKMSTEAWVYYDAIARTGTVTDKQPYNYLYVPLLTRLFPGCTIIHTTRDPQDTCLSNFFQSFSRPHPQTQTLDRLGRYHRDYRRLMAAYADLPGVDLFEVPYEQLVQSPREVLSPALEHAGLAWDDAILDFHNSDRAVSTSSRDQVRRPLYQSSVSKHERYAEHLVPLRSALGISAD